MRNTLFSIIINKNINNIVVNNKDIDVKKT